MKNSGNELVIVQVVTCPDGGGAEVLSRKLASELHNRGFNSFIIYFSNPRKLKSMIGNLSLNQIHSRSLINIFLLKKNNQKIKI